ncbi:MAG: T9SS type A sorting domain-containing protein [Ginsengibacter sp.]
MTKLFALAAWFFSMAFYKTFAGVKLTAIPDTRTSSVLLQWNMVDYSSATSYALLKSTDGVIWLIAAANPVYRNYTSSSILAFRDATNNKEKIFYKVRVFESHDNTIALSNTAIVETHKAIYRGNGNKQDAAVTQRPGPSDSGNNAWQLYPNPVTDILNLSYKRNDRPRGVINVTITDAAGKIVVRFRQASNNMQLRIAVSNLPLGLYFIKINVLDEMQLNDKFVKH